MSCATPSRDRGAARGHCAGPPCPLPAGNTRRDLAQNGRPTRLGRRHVRCARPETARRTKHPRGGGRGRSRDPARRSRDARVRACAGGFSGRTPVGDGTAAGHSSEPRAPAPARRASRPRQLPQGGAARLAPRARPRLRLRLPGPGRHLLGDRDAAYGAAHDRGERCRRRRYLVSARRLVARGLIVVGALVGLHATSRASLFGEENITLGAILTETIKSYNELRNITDAVGDGVDLAGDLLDAYHKVNAGIDELRGYSVDAFLHDFKGDMYNLYPGLAKIE